jgi:hypothetical protein
MKQPEKACQISKEALEDALDVIDECNQADVQEAHSIIDLLRENLTIWSEELGEEMEE